jgi:hypothetical protein
MSVRSVIWVLENAGIASNRYKRRPCYESAARIKLTYSNPLVPQLHASSL